MMMYVPRAASMPPIRALPYPFSLIGTTRAPAASASCWLPSVLPLSAIRTSPSIPLSARNPIALRTHVATVSASLRQGMTTVSSTSSPSARIRGLRYPAGWSQSPGRVRLLRVMPVTTPRAQSAARIGSIRSLLLRIWNGHRLFVIVLIPPVLLRVDAELGYRWQVWFNDSFDYIQHTVQFQLDPTRPSGYSIWLKILEPFHTYALVTILQHLMGIAIAVMVYALARHRFGVPAWAATLATVPVLYDGFEIQLEHLILADIPCLFVLTVAVTVLLWSKEKPSLLRCMVLG